jgi:hypothetical protein
MALPVGLVLAEPVQGKCRGCGRPFAAFACGHDAAACAKSHDPAYRYAAALPEAPRGPSGRPAWADGTADPLPTDKRLGGRARAARRRVRGLA